MKIQFRDELPGRSADNRRYIDFAAKLRAFPGKWARWPHREVGRQAYYRVDNIKRGSVKAMPPDEFEARTVDRHTWVRYVPRQQSGDSQ